MGEKLKPSFDKTERKYRVSCTVKALLTGKYLKILSSDKLILPEYFYYYEIRDFTHKTEGTTRRPGVTKETLAERNVCG
jgi:hypothetical protein